MKTFPTVYVFTDAPARLPELLAGAATLGEKVAAFVLGSATEVAAAHAHGAHTVYCLGEKKHIVEDYAPTIASVLQQALQPALLLVAGTRCGKAMASLLGVACNAGVVTEAAEVAAADNVVTVKHMVYGGLALGEEKIISSLAIVVVGNGVFSAQTPDASHTGETVALEFVPGKGGITCLSRHAKQSSSVDLSKAKRIVAVGRGIAKEEDLQLAAQLCSAMQAEMGCSRPIAEAEKWMEHARYIGISGVMPKPEVYLALGISGQIQHMVGVNGAQTIIAVNKDKNAPIFQYADYGIVGDLYKIVPSLINALK